MTTQAIKCLSLALASTLLPGGLLPAAASPQELVAPKPDLAQLDLGFSSDLVLTETSLPPSAIVAEAVAFELAQVPFDNAAEPDLRIRPRVGASYSTASGSNPALGRFEAFVPLWQTVGDELGFLEGRLLVNSDDTLGGGLLLGYRGYSETAERVRGGYLSLDGRGTGASSFYQLGTGYESLGQDWDFRFNAYWPLGDRDRTITDIAIDTGLQTSTRFQGNLLLLETQRQRQRLLQQETALGGFDAEAGTPLARWDNGNLKGFGGIYLYGAPNLSSYLGWRLRLAADLTPNFNTGLALQGDGLFGTRLVFSVGATFPGIRAAAPFPEVDQVRARLGEPTVRLPEIAVFVASQTEAFSTQESQPLLNPEEEQAYRFQHVRLGGSGGDGTFENPFGTVAEALNATARDGNDVVYVDGATDGPIPALTIPDRVQLLSQGPRQLLSGLPFPGFETTTARLPFSPELNYADGIVVELPFSGDGNFPRIDGVTLGNRTVLAGFRFENTAGEAAILGRSISNVELRNNTITAPQQRGIFLDDVGGSAVLFDTVVTDAQGAGPTSGQGIFIRNTTTFNSIQATIAGFQADRNRVGIELAAEGVVAPPFQVPNQEVSIGPSSTANTSIGLSPGAVITNSASNNSAEGVLIRASNLGGQEIDLQGLALSDNGSDGLRVIGGVPGGFLISFQEVRVQDSAIARNSGAGLRIEANESATQEFNIDGNQIVDNAGAGIISTAGDSALQEFVAKPELGSLGIGNNIITGNGGNGIELTTTDAQTLLVEANQNQLANNAGGQDVQVTADGTARVCFIAFGNTTAPAIALDKVTLGLFEVADRDNLSFNNNGATVNLSPAPGSFTNIARQACL
ncbi:right-handed parallel beta-helix repeat-containing protein [Nodosilinea sp. AN01ver1]|uniref:right-handed parallel beta-helix repeat-containing protein n=1 Tax=Nodosilinea sp. AN01ver1 TaxID=3423362 RepID=UPI003D321B94